MSQTERKVVVDHYRNYANETRVVLHGCRGSTCIASLNRAEAEQLLTDLRAALGTDDIERTVKP